MTLNVVMLDPTPLPIHAAPTLATMPDPERDVEPDKDFASPREDVTPLVLADLQFPKDTETSAVKERFAMEKVLASTNHQKSKLPLFFTSVLLFILKI